MKNSKPTYEELERRCREAEARLAAMETMRKSEEAFRLLVEHSNDIIWTFDLATMRSTYASPSVEQLLGYSAETIEGATLDDIFDKEAQQGILREFGRVVEGMAPDDRVVMEAVHRHRDGGRVWMEISASAIRAADGQVTGFTGISREITDRKRAELALQHSERRLNEAQRMARIASYRRNLDTGEGYWSDQCYRLFGYEPGEVEPSFELYLSHIHEDDRERVKRILTESYERLTPNAFDCRYVRRDGEIRHAQHRGEAVIDEDSRSRWLRGTFQDITDRKRAELALQHSERRLNEAQRMARIASYERDLATGEGYWSDEHYRVFGYEPGEVEHSFELFLSHIHEDDRERARNILVNAYENLEPYAYDTRFVRKDGEVRYAHATGVGVMDEDGKRRWVRGTFQDITERKQIEEMLRDSEQRHRVIFENAPLGMIRFSPDGTILDCNDRFISLMGSSRDKLIGFNTARQSTPVMRETIKRALAGETAVYEEEYTSITGGKTTYLRVAFNPVNPGQSPTGVIATLEDVGERKRREIELKRSEARFRAVFEQAAAGISIVNPDGYILDVNRKFSEMLGYPKGELTGLTVPAVTHPDDLETETEIINRLDESNETFFNLEKRYIRKDGRAIWANLSSNIVRDESGKVAFAVGVVVDITDRVNAEQALKESEERFRKMFEETPIGIAFADVQTARFIRVNPALRQMLGYKESELLGLTVADISCPEENLKNDELLTESINRQSSSFSMEKRYIRKDGEIIWGNLTSSIIYHEDGRPRYRFGMVENITDRKRAEAALKQSEAEKALILNTTQEMIAYYRSPDLTIAWANRSALEGSGSDEQELESKHCYELWQNRIEPCEDCPVLTTYDSGRPMTAEKTAPDGKVWLIRTYPAIEDGRVTGVIELGLDITERKRAEMALRESEDKLRKAFDTEHVAIAISRSEDGTYLEANPGFLKLTGYAYDDIIGHTSRELKFFTSYQRQILISRLAKEGHLSNEELTFPTKSGETRTILFSIGPIILKGRNCFLATMIDITDRKRAEMEIVAARRAAEAASRAKSDFISNMSHELRTPLNAILGYGQLLSRDPGLTETHRDQIATIRRSGDHLLTLINDILDISRIEAEKTAIDPGPTALKALVANIVEMMGLRAARKRIDLTTWIDPAVPAFVMADDKRLRQVLLNLLSNAVKFTHKGSVRLTVRRSGGRISFQVADTGVGIPDDQQEVIFESFTQLGNILNKEEGTGLGLAISRKLARMMGGDITVKSTVGMGSVFSFEVALPRADGGPESEWLTDGPVKVVSRSGASLKALIVDDKSMDRRVMGDLLKAMGIEVREVAGGEAALDQILAFWPDVVLLDWVLPEGMSGDAVAREIRKMIPENGPAIIVVTGKADGCIEAAAREVGADDCLIKPVRMNDLQKALEAHLPLTWTPEGSDKPLEDEHPAELEILTPPPLEDIKAIHELSRIGDIRGIGRHLERVREYSPNAADFCDAMEGWVNRFELRRIRELMEQLMGKTDEN